ncbi:hypothetical protein ACQ9BO_19495 [Flavobacterium sp. P21]|uniref:hypothetical protein n=1 Tax=Flavobacterium sp. P21 TaxID=3423948 RepID=UPI003D67E22F
MEKAKMILIEYRKQFNDYANQPYYSSVNNLLYNYNKYLKDSGQNESNIDEISQDILLSFLKEIDNLLENPNDDKFGIIDLANLVSALRKDIFFVKSTALVYSKSMEKRYTEYFSEENDHFKRLKEIQETIHKRLDKLNVKNL